MPSQLRLLIADRAATRLGVRVALQGQPTICAEAESAADAIRLAKRMQPHVCLIGWELPGTGAAAVRGVTRAAPVARVVVLADEADPDAMLEAIKLGAVGFLPGGVTATALRKVLSAVLAREAVLPRAMVSDLLIELRSAAGEIDGLTGREAQVLALLRRGHSTAIIAKRLDIAPVTVRRHISELVRKFGVGDRSDLLHDVVRWDPAGVAAPAA